LARRAGRLVIIEAGPQEEPRTFFSDKARHVFAALAENAEHMDYGQLCEVLESGEIFETGEKKTWRESQA
jgi:hypothetical protein